jgi:hypothetical protein
MVEYNVIKLLLEKENKLRTSAEWIERFTNAYSESGGARDWIDEAELLQEGLITEFMGDDISVDDLNFGLNVLRTATQRFPDLKDIPLYIKYNRAKQGHLKVGDVAPDIALFDLNLKSVKLLDYTDTKPLLVIGGSYS